MDLYKEEKCLKTIINKHTIPKNNNKIQVRLYHKTKKLSSQFSTRPQNENEVHHVVYQLSCQEFDCTHTYIGFTTNKLIERGYKHKYCTSLAKFNNIT